MTYRRNINKSSSDKSYYTLFYNGLLPESTESCKILLYRRLRFLSHSSRKLAYSSFFLFLSQTEFIHVHNKGHQHTNSNCSDQNVGCGIRNPGRCKQDQSCHIGDHGVQSAMPANHLIFVQVQHIFPTKDKCITFLDKKKYQDNLCQRIPGHQTCQQHKLHHLICQRIQKFADFGHSP